MKTSKNSISLIGLLAMSLSFIGYCVGLWFPILSTKQSVFGITLKYQEVRVTDSIKLYFNSGNYLLSLIIVLFVIVTPMIKYIDLVISFISFESKQKFAKYLSAIDKWSMIDVFLVALLVLNFKMNSSIIVMKLKIGTSFIVLYVIFRIIARQFLKNYKYYCYKNNILKK